MPFDSYSFFINVFCFVLLSMEGGQRRGFLMFLSEPCLPLARTAVLHHTSPDPRV